MRSAIFAWVVGALLSVGMPMSAADEAKISADLLQTIQSDHDARVDITVQLASTDQVLEETCGRDDSTEDRGQRVACIAGSLQTFAEQIQQPVRALLDDHTDQFDSVMFLWIDNSVAIKGVHPELVQSLAQLDVVKAIDMEQMFAIPGDNEIFMTTD